MPDNHELEKTLWAAADKLRSNMDAAEYKHVVLGPADGTVEAAIPLTPLPRAVV